MFDINDTTVSSLQSDLEDLRSHVSSEFKLIPVANKIDKHDFIKIHAEFSEFQGILLFLQKKKKNVNELRQLQINSNQAC